MYELFNFWRVQRRVNVRVMTFHLYCTPVRCGNTRFFRSNMGGFLAILDGHAGVADSDCCERNPFARDIFRLTVANMQKFERNRNNCLPISVRSSHICTLKESKEGSTYFGVFSCRKRSKCEWRGTCTYRQWRLSQSNFPHPPDSSGLSWKVDSPIAFHLGVPRKHTQRTGK